jgi:septum formation protein
MTHKRLILASGSPRRRELMAAAGYQFDVVEPRADAECGICSEGGPAALVAELALRKAADVRPRIDRGYIVAADTVAECGGMILGKPEDIDHARRMLRQLAGQEHRVYTGVCVWPVPDGEPVIRVAVTRLKMEPLGDEALEEYLSGGGWEGKAGAFGYQDRHGWLHIVEGSESNVVGLPMELLAEMLDAAGYRAT